MRWPVKVIITALFGFVALELAFGQLPTQLGGLGGLMGKDNRTDPLTLLRNSGVKKELRLTDAQAAKIDDAVWEGLAKVLDSEQLKRLKQIDLQQRDYFAFSDPSLQAALKMTKDQKDNIKTILADADRELTSLTDSLKAAFTGGGIGAGKGLAGLAAVPEKINSIRKDTRDRCTEVLTGEQKRMWEEMVGDDFKIELPKFDFPDAKKPNKKKGG
jgi:hypothetical protein